jgi:hypothetical protein
MTENNTKKPSDDLDALLDGKINDFTFDHFVVKGLFYNFRNFDS